MTAHRIVIVGGGAGGLELAVRLGETLARRARAEVTLVDRSLTHLWKPLLHEVAAGTLDSHEDVVEYLAQARDHHFRFRLGAMNGLDRRHKQVHLAAIVDEEGKEVTPARRLDYDTLVIAVGAQVNTFGVPGVEEHCTLLDGTEEAERFHRAFLNHHLRAQAGGGEDARLSIGIVGAGATGVELAAELHAATRQLSAYGFDRISPERDTRILLIEAADRVLPALPARVSRAAAGRLKQIGVEVHTNAAVNRITEAGIHTEDGRVLPCRMKVWVTGIKAPGFLAELDGLETNKAGQLVVRASLQTTLDDDVFAFGDCAGCPWPGHERPVPPRAQAAHQQAMFLTAALARRLDGKAPGKFAYTDRGSLVSLSRYSTLGSLMGNLLGEITFEGWMARLAYRSLYRMHQRVVYGLPRTLLIIAADWFRHGVGPALKLH